MRRRYDVRYDAATRRYVVEVVDETGQRRYIESCVDWQSADSMRSHANGRLETSGELLPDRL